MKLLDVFCCSGGASKGYHDAGFEVTGVDIKSQPNYPFEFIKADAMDVLKDKDFLSQFDVIHASPPCQGYSNATRDDSKYVPYSQGKQTPKLIPQVRDLIKHKHHIIENVAGARFDLINPCMLSGFMFGLPIERKRYFECSFLLLPPCPMFPRGYTKRYAEQNGIDYRDMSVTGKSRRSGSIEVWKNIMQMPWAGRAWELSEAIPPAYTKFIGEQFLKSYI